MHRIVKYVLSLIIVSTLVIPFAIKGDGVSASIDIPRVESHNPTYMIEDYIYVAGVTVQKIYKYDKDLNYICQSPDYGGDINVLCADENYIYAGGYTTQRVRRYLKTDLTYVDQSLDYGGAIWGIAVDESYVYVTGGTTKRIYKLDKTDLSFVSSSDAISTTYGLYDCKVDYDYVYVNTPTIRIYDKTNFSYIGNVYGGSGQWDVDDYYIYSMTDGALYDFIYKFDIATRTQQSVVQIYTPRGLYAYGNYIYMADNSFPLRKRNKSDLSIVSAASGTTGKYIIGDGTYLYTWTTYNVYKVRMSDLATVDSENCYSGGVIRSAITGWSEFVFAPTVTTNNATDITETSATLNGNITSTGGLDVTERGFDWDYDSGTPYEYDWTEEGTFGTGAFDYSVSDLPSYHQIYFRAKAYNSLGWSYGSELSFYTSEDNPLGLIEKMSLDWEYGDVFQDDTAYDNDGYPTFRTTSSDEDVVGTITKFEQIKPARAPKYTITGCPEFYTEDITASSNFTYGEVPTGGPPGFEIVEDAAQAGGTPNIWLWGLLAIFAIAASGLFLSYMERKHGSGGGTLIIRILIPTIIFGILIMYQKFDWWMLVIYLMIVGAILMWSRHTEWGGVVSQYGLIGFLSMSWIGLTLINRILEMQFLTVNEQAWANKFAFVQEFKAFDVFTIPVLNFSFFTQGIPSLIRWDYSFFGGNAQLIQYLLYSITAVVSFIIFCVIIGLLFNAFRTR